MMQPFLFGIDVLDYTLFLHYAFAKIILLHNIPVFFSVPHKDLFFRQDIFCCCNKNPFVDHHVFCIIGKAIYSFISPGVIGIACQRVVLFAGIDHVVPGNIEQVSIAAFIIGVFKAADPSGMFGDNSALWNKYLGEQSFATAGQGRCFDL